MPRQAKCSLAFWFSDEIVTRFPHLSNARFMFRSSFHYSNKIN
jgi:hypothetical protein